MELPMEVHLGHGGGDLVGRLSGRSNVVNEIWRKNMTPKKMSQNRNALTNRKNIQNRSPKPSKLNSARQTGTENEHFLEKNI